MAYGYNDLPRSIQIELVTKLIGLRKLKHVWMGDTYVTVEDVRGNKFRWKYFKGEGWKYVGIR